MPKAALRSQQLQQESIDAAAGVIYGVKVAQNKHVARFNSPGGVKQITITENHIGALRDFAGNRAIPVHWTHDYLNSEKDRLNVKVGALKNLRTDGEGNLVADFHVAPTEYRDRIFWNAANDPEGMMLSAVFDYGAHDPECTPLSFDAADLVAEGAGVKALFSKTQETDTDMTKEEIEALINARMKSSETERAALAKKNEDQETEAAILAAEKEAGVEDQDRKPEDSKLPAALASVARIQRATMRKMEAVKSEAKTLAKAEFMAAIGSADFQISTGKAQSENFEAAVKAEFAAQPEGKKDISRARFAAAQKNPELYNRFRASGAVATAA